MLRSYHAIPRATRLGVEDNFNIFANLCIACDTLQLTEEEKVNDCFPDVAVFADAGMRKVSRIFRLTESFRYRSSVGTIRIPKGFHTDGASVPKIFWNIFSPFGSYFSAALVHDFLYSKDSDSIFPAADRAEADRIFLEAMYNAGVSWLTRHTVHSAVRLGGWASYKKKHSNEP
jgi:hypothetical protein